MYIYIYRFQISLQDGIYLESQRSSMFWARTPNWKSSMHASLQVLECFKNVARSRLSPLLARKLFSLIPAQRVSPLTSAQVASFVASRSLLGYSVPLFLLFHGFLRETRQLQIGVLFSTRIAEELIVPFYPRATVENEPLRRRDGRSACAHRPGCTRSPNAERC